jgi:hypothetical protein
MSRLARRVQARGSVVISMLVITPTWLLAAPALSAQASRAASAPKAFAQKLAEDTLAAHPETGEVEIAATSGGHCTMIASTNNEDLGDKCERDSTEPMRTGQPFVEKEKDDVEVSLPLHDASGKLVGAVGIAFKVSTGRTDAATIAMARRIVAEMEPHIPSASVLLGR